MRKCIRARYSPIIPSENNYKHLTNRPVIVSDSTVVVPISSSPLVSTSSPRGIIPFGSLRRFVADAQSRKKRRTVKLV